MNITVAVASRRVARIMGFVFVTLFGSSAFNAALAGPEGENVIRGRGSVARPNAHTTNVTQQTARLVIDWQTFNVAANETVNFLQPSADAAVLNRILDQNPSQIFGAINANGRVLLINPHGFLFGETASINVGALLASSLSMDLDEFMNGEWRLFAADPETLGSIINRGLIHAADAGFVGLLGGAVSNEGVIVANYGEVVLGAGTEATVDFDGDGLIRFRVDGELQANIEERAAAVSNTGSISAAEGLVILTADTATEVFSQAVNNGGLIAATGIQNDGGRVYLAGGRGDAVSTGTVDVSSATAYGGRVEITGNRVGLFGDSVTNATGATGGGTVLVGGDYQGTGETDTAELTVVSSNSVIDVSATGTGNGGKAIFWADDSTWFNGTIFSLGGSENGNGGFVEISGKGGLVFAGHADLGAVNGELGSLLFDPDDISIVVGTAGSGGNDIEVGGGDGSIAFGDGAGTFVISDGQLNTITADITLQANNSITAGSGVNVTLASGGGGKDLVMTTTSGNITLTGATFQTLNGGTIMIQAGGSVNTGTLIADTGDINVIAANNIVVDGAVSTNSTSTTAISLLATGGNISGEGSLSATSSTGADLTAGGSITLNGGVSLPASLYVLATSAELTSSSDIQLRSASGISGQFTLHGANLTDTGAVSIGTLALDISGNATIDGDGSLAGASTVGELVGVGGGDDAANVTIITSSGITIDDFQTAGNLTITANDSVIHAFADPISVDGTLTLNAGAASIAFDGNTGEHQLAVVDIARADAGTYIYELDGFDFAGVDTGSLAVGVQSGTVTDSGAITVDVIGTSNGLISLFEGSFVLDGNVSLSGAGWLSTASAATNVEIDASSSIVLGNISNTGTLALTSDESISQTGFGSISGPSSIVIAFNNGNRNLNLGNAGNQISSISVAQTGSQAGNVTITDLAGGIVLDGINASGTINITSTAGDITTSDAIVAGGTATFTANEAGSDIILNDLNNDFSSSIVTSSSGGLNDVTIYNTGAIVLGNLSITGNLELSSGGTITQPGATLGVGGGLVIRNATSVTLNNSGNTFTEIHVNDGGGGAGASLIDIKDDDGFAVGVVNVANQARLGVTTAGNITQAFGGSITAPSLLLDAGTGNNVTLNGDNDIDQLQLISGADISFTDTDGVQFLNSLAAVNTLDMNASGLVDQAGGSAVLVNNLLDINAGTAGITLTESGNAFGSINLTGGTAALRENSAIVVAGASVGYLDLASNGTITQMGAISTVTGMDLSAGGDNAVTLQNLGNAIAGPITASNVGTLSITSNGNIDLGAITTTGAGANLVVSSIGGSISDSGTLSVVDGSFTAQNAADIILDNPSNAFSGNVSVILNGAGSLHDVHIVDNDSTALSLGAMTLSGDLTLVANQGVGQSGAWVLTNPASVADISSNGTITLGQANNFQELRSSGTTVIVTDINGIKLGATTATSGFTLNAGGSIDSNDTLTITGTAQFNLIGGTPVDLLLSDAGNAFNGSFAVSLAGGTTLNDVSITDTTTLQLPGMSVGGDLTVDAAGISQLAGITVTGLTTLDSGTSNILLSNNLNDFQGNVHIATANDVDIKDSNNLVLGDTGSGTSDINGALTATSVGGNIFDGGVIDVAGVTTLAASTAGRQIVLDNDHLLGGNVSFTGSASLGAVEINDTSGGLVLVSGLSATSLTLTAAGTISSAFMTTVSGTTDITVTGASGHIVFNNSLNDFNQVSLDADDASATSVIRDANSLQLGVVDLGGDLTIQLAAAASTLTQTAAGSILVDDQFWISSANSSVTLDNIGNDFGSLRIEALSADIQDLDDLSIVQATVTGAGTALDLTTGGDLNQTGAIQVANGTTDLNVTGNLNWNNLSNNFNQLDFDVSGTATVRDAGAIVLGNVDIDGASFTLNAGGAVSQAAGTTILVNAAAATTTVNSAGQVVTLNNTGNDFSTVGVTAASATLRDAGAVDIGTSTVAGTLTVNAGGHVTDSNNINAATLQLNLTTTANATLNSTGNDFDTVNVSSGHDLVLADTDDLTLGSLSLTGLADVSAGDDLTATSITVGTGSSLALGSTGGGIVLNGALTANGAGTVSLQADGGLLDINAAINAGTGAADLDGQGVDFAAAADIAAASVAVDANGAGNDIFMADGAVIDTSAGTGDIDLVADDQVTLGQLLAGGDASVTASNGGIVDGTVAESVNVSADRITLLADTGIGSADDIETNAMAATGRSLDVRLTSAGDIDISETGVAQVFAVADDGDIRINANGNIFIDQIAANGTGNTVTLVTSGGAGIQDMQDDNTVDIDADNISLNAGAGSVGGAALVGSTTDSDGFVELDGNLTLIGDNISVADSGVGASRTLTVTAGGDFAFSFANDIFIDDVTSAGDVTLISTAGNLFDRDDDAVTDITSGGVIDLRADSAIGGEIFGNAAPTDGNIELDAATIKAYADGGPIKLVLDGAAILQNIEAVAGDVEISGSGNLEIDAITASGDVTLETDGAIVDINAEQSLIEGEVVTLEAATGIGSSTSTDRVAVSADTLHLTTATGVIGVEESNAVILGTVANNGGAVHLSSGGQMSLGFDITTTGATLQLSGSVLLAADVTLASNGGSILLDGLVTGAGNDLTVSSGTGGVTLASGTTGVDTFIRNGSGGFVVGGDLGAATVDINSSVSLNAGVDITASTGAIDISGNLMLSGAGVASTLQALNDADINIDGNASVVGGNRSLSLFSQGSISVGGNIQLGTGALSASIDTDGDAAEVLDIGNISAGSFVLSGNGGNDTFGIVTVVTAGDISMAGGGTISDGTSLNSTSGDITMNGDYSAGSLTLSAVGMNLNGDLATSAGGNVAITNSGTMTLGGDLSLGGRLTQVGGGTVILAGDIATTADAVTINSGVNLSGGDRNISTGAGGGDITLNGPATGGGDNLSLDSGSGNLLVQDIAGVNTLQLAGNDLVTSGDISATAIDFSGMTGQWLIANNTSISTTDTSPDFSAFSSINGVPGAASNLNVNLGSGDIDLSGVPVGQVESLVSLTLAAASIQLGQVSTTDAQHYTGDTTLTSSVEGGSLRFDGDIVLAASSVWNVDGNVGVNGAVDGARALSVMAGGNVRFNGAVGESEALNSLSIAANGISLFDVSTSGMQSYTGETHIVGQLDGQSLDFNGDLQVDGDSLLVADIVHFDGGANSVSGNGQLTIVPETDGQAIVLSPGSGSSTDSLILDAAALDGFSGGLIIGGIEDSEGNPEIIASSISVQGGIDTGESRLALYSRESIDLVSGRLSAEELYLIVSGPEGVITNSGGFDTLLESDLIVLVAAEAIGEEGQYLEARSESGSGTMLVGTSSLQAFVNNFNNQLDVQVNFASDLILKFAQKLQINLSDETQLLGSAQSSAGREQGGGLADEGFIDSSLFQEIALFESSGSGIALPGDQSEEAPADCEDKDAQAGCGVKLKPYPMPARNSQVNSMGAPN